MQDKWKELEGLIAKDYGNTSGIVILKNGATLYEGYYNGNSPTDATHVFSVTKSVLSALVGVAVGKGLIGSVERRVFDFFPEYTPGNKTAELVTLRRLLTMTASFQRETEPYAEYFGSGDRLGFALGLLGGGEPERFRYSPFLAAHILSGVLVSATGQPLLDFAAENLFAPLGCETPKPIELNGEREYWAWHEKPRHEPGWVVEGRGISPGGWGLCLTPTAMAKVGELHRNRGLWEGRQLLPESWARESVAVQSRWEEMNLGYGYLWWVLEDGVYAAMGDGGNIIYVNEAKGLVIAIACRFEEGAKDRVGLIKCVIEPMAE